MRPKLALRQKDDPIARVLARAMRAALERHRGNVRRTALELGLSYRQAHRWINELGLRPELEGMRGEQ